MKRALTSAELREVDRAAEVHGMPVSVLMENAGAAAAEEALRWAVPKGRFFVLCGRGNNGGDGLVAARKLAAAGRQVQVELVGDPQGLQGDVQRSYQALRAAGVTPGAMAEGTARAGDVVLDALLGTGLNRAPEGAYAAAIERIATLRAAGAQVLAVDIPSGLHSDTGQPFTPCVQADATVSFAFPKLGQVVEPGASLCGALRVADIGIPAAAAAVLKPPAVYLLEEEDARQRLPGRRAESHKGTYGHVLIVAGSLGISGAAAMAGLGALRAGAGLVTVATRREALTSALAHAPELMGFELANDGALALRDLNALSEATLGKAALVVGPGIPRGEETGKLLGALLEDLSAPAVLDADALNALAGHLELLAAAQGPLILTPHPGEMARLVGKSTREVQADRIGTARGLAELQRACVVLKGARTVIATPDGTAYINPTGNPGMATAGTGDVLSGVLGALLGQGLSPVDAAVAGVYAHGLAGDGAVRRTGQLGLVATDLLEALGEVWVRWSR